MAPPTPAALNGRYRRQARHFPSSTLRPQPSSSASPTLLLGVLAPQPSPALVTAPALTLEETPGKRLAL